MIDVKRFSGVLNTDDQPENVLAPQHIDARNVRFYGGQNGLSAQNIKGNNQLNTLTLPAGTNQCIGSFFDSLKQRIIFFNYNSNGNNGIYSLNLKTDVISTIFLCGTNSATDILNFNTNYPVHSSSIVYRDSSQGDLIYWTDGFNRPKYLNIDTVSSLAPFTATMITAAKLPPSKVAICGYASDSAINYNNVYNRYFRFAYRWVYKNGEKSTFSPISEMPTIPTQNPEDPVAPNTSNYILISNINTPSDNDFKSIELFGQEFNGTIWDSYFFITEINRSATPLPYTDSFKFYNDGIYAPITDEESDLRYDYLPDVANTLELLNGNVIIYGGITEGVNTQFPQRSEYNVQITSSLTNQTSYPEAWKWGQTERFGLVYFDKYGKTNGVISYLDTPADSNNFEVTTPQYPGETFPSTAQVPQISASINHTPPTWAESYQWVRIDAAPQFFLQWVTNDYQDPGDGYLYFGIETLNWANSKDGIVPAYEWQPGDRVKVMGKLTSSFTVAAFGTQYDFDVLSDLTRPMGAPNTITPGRFLKVKKIVGLPYVATDKNLLIEIYTPAPNVNSENAIFFEWGQKYGIYSIGNNRYHLGQTQNQTASQPALFVWKNGYVYWQSNVPFYSYMAAAANAMPHVYCTSMSRFRNVFQNSKANSNSRGWFIDVNAIRRYLPTHVRWGGAYVQDTLVNNLNRFYPQDLDMVDVAKGDIRRFKARDRILRVFQDRAVGQYGVYARFIQNNQGQSELVTTNTIITTNNIQYYAGTYGLCGYPTNLASSAASDYFTDVVTGRSIRVGRDGITDLGLLYKGQFYLSELVLPYNKTINRPSGEKSKVMGFFDSFDNQYHVFLQGDKSTLFLVSQSFDEKGFVIYLGGNAVSGDSITVSISTSSIDSQFTYTASGSQSALNFLNGLAAAVPGSFTAVVTNASPYPYITIQPVAGEIITASASLNVSGSYEPHNFSFNETRNAFCSFYDYHPEWATGANDMIYTWLDGYVYKHNNTVKHCNFYGNQYDASVTFVFNPNIHTKKSWNSLMEIANTIWTVPTMYTNTYSYGTTKQVSNLVEAEFQLLEGNPSAAIKRDANSIGGKVNGNFMKGNYLVVKFQKTNAINLVNLNEVSARFTDSPLTVK